jgi:E3 ubiquitin-protein ligase BIG BROTHER-like protein
MDGSSKGIGGGASADKPTTDHQDQNASPNVPAGAGVNASAAAEGRRPFTSLSQEEADLALARVLQEQVSSRDLGISRVG